MPGLKALFGQTIAPLLCTSGQLVAVDALGPRFVRVVVKGPDIRAADFHPGDKVQALLADGEFRTWTPFAAVDDTVSFVVFAHGDASTPSARFAKTAKVGDTVSYFGPRGSLPIADVDGPAVLVGDETAFAVARTLRDHRAAAAPASDDARFVFEVDDVAEATVVTDALGLTAASRFVVKAAGDAHIAALADAVDGAVKQHGASRLFFAGRATTTQALKAKVKQSSTSSTVAQKAKGYWAPGKRGLD